MMDKIQTLQQIADNAKSMVFFGGAGVSTESGIPDFRSEDGLYHQKYDVAPEVMLSHGYYRRHPEDFFRFYRDKMIAPHAKPNAAHRWLAEAERRGKLRCVITQNIDGLHQAAGSKTVYELHGSVMRNYCEKCGAFYPLSFIQQGDGVPTCACGGRVKPDVVLYEEPLNDKVFNAALAALDQADVLIVAGTSLTVYPAAGMIRAFHGDSLVLINRDPTPMDHLADLVIHGKVGEVLSQISL